MFIAGLALVLLGLFSGIAIILDLGAVVLVVGVVLLVAGALGHQMGSRRWWF